MTQIKYQVDKLLQATFGIADQDAYEFVKLAQKEAKDGGYFVYEVNSKQEFRRSLYISKAMLIYARYFLDIVIIDTTYRRNRFNLPLVNVIGINNCGQNIMLAFSLLSEETSDSYTWFFNKLKEAWGTLKPLNFVTDDCKEIKQGKIIYIVFFFICFRV